MVPGCGCEDDIYLGLILAEVASSWRGLLFVDEDEFEDGPRELGRCWTGVAWQCCVLYWQQTAKLGSDHLERCAIETIRPASIAPGTGFRQPGSASECTNVASAFCALSHASRLDVKSFCLEYGQYILQQADELPIHFRKWTSHGSRVSIPPLKAIIFLQPATCAS